LGYGRLLQRFRQDQRALEMDYMLSLVVFILSLAFTFLILTQYMDLKAVEVGEVNRKLACLRLVDDLTGSPGWIGGRTDWEAWVSLLDLQEKVNDESLSLGLRRNDRFFGFDIIVPAASDPVMQTAGQDSILSVVEALKKEGAAVVEAGGVCQAVFLVDTLSQNGSIVFPGSVDNATTHIGTFFAGGELTILVSDTRADGALRYDTILVGNTTLREGEQFTAGGRDFQVRTIDQERVLLSGYVVDGFILPNLDLHFHDLAVRMLSSAGVRYSYCQRFVSAGSSVEYALFCRSKDKFVGDLIELSTRKIEALRDFVPYGIAKALLGLQYDFNLRLTRDRDGAVLLDYGELVPVSDTARAERQVGLDGEPCTLVVNVW